MQLLIVQEGGNKLTHRVSTNTTGKVMELPTGQIVMPGQSYAEPEAAAPAELKESEISPVIVQTIADPEATQKAIAASKRNKPGDK